MCLSGIGQLPPGGQAKFGFFDFCDKSNEGDEDHEGNEDEEGEEGEEDTETF